MDEAICDQLIDCCRSSNLEKTGTVTLKYLQDIARATEALDIQVKQWIKPQRLMHYIEKLKIEEGEVEEEQVSEAKVP